MADIVSGFILEGGVFVCSSFLAGRRGFQMFSGIPAGMFDQALKGLSSNDSFNMCHIVRNTLLKQC